MLMLRQPSTGCISFTNVQVPCLVLDAYRPERYPKGSSKRQAGVFGDARARKPSSSANGQVNCDSDQNSVQALVSKGGPGERKQKDGKLRKDPDETGEGEKGQKEEEDVIASASDTAVSTLKLGVEGEIRCQAKADSYTDAQQPDCQSQIHLRSLDDLPPKTSPIIIAVLPGLAA